MLPSESPFPCHWWGTGLEDAGLGVAVGVRALYVLWTDPDEEGWVEAYRRE